MMHKLKMLFAIVFQTISHNAHEGMQTLVPQLLASHEHDPSEDSHPTTPNKILIFFVQDNKTSKISLDYHLKVLVDQCPIPLYGGALSGNIFFPDNLPNILK